MQFLWCSFLLVTALGAPALAAPTDSMAAPQIIVPASSSSAVVGPGERTLVSTNIGTQTLNQSFSAGNSPIVAILPPGANLTATWDLSSNQQPTVGFELMVSTLPSAPVLANNSAMIPVAAAVPAAVPFDNSSIANVTLVPAAVPAAVLLDNSTAVNVTSAPAVPAAVLLDNSTAANVTSAPAAVLVDNSTAVNVTSAPAAATSAPLLAFDNIIPPPVAVADSPVSPLAVPANQSIPQVAGPVAGNRRVDVQLVAFQMNNSANTPITQNIMLSAQLIFNMMLSNAVSSANVSNNSIVSTNVPGVFADSSIMAHFIPVSLSGIAVPQVMSAVLPVYNGTYSTDMTNNSTGASNNVQVGRTITQDICGQTLSGGSMMVVVAPLSAADVGMFPVRSYNCTLLLEQPSQSGPSDTTWSSNQECNSGDINGLSLRLWYKIREYNVAAGSCNQNPANAVTVV